MSLFDSECPNAPLLCAKSAYSDDEDSSFSLADLCGFKNKIAEIEDEEVPSTPGGQSLLFPGVPLDRLFVLGKVPTKKGTTSAAEGEVMKVFLAESQGQPVQKLAATSEVFIDTLKEPSSSKTTHSAANNNTGSQQKIGSSSAASAASTEGSATRPVPPSPSVAAVAAPFNMWSVKPSPRVAARRISSSEDVKSLFPKSLSTREAGLHRAQVGVHTGRMTAQDSSWGAGLFSPKMWLVLLVILAVAVTASLTASAFPDAAVKLGSDTHLCEIIQAKDLREKCLREEARKRAAKN